MVLLYQIVGIFVFGPVCPIIDAAMYVGDDSILSLKIVCPRWMSNMNESFSKGKIDASLHNLPILSTWMKQKMNESIDFNVWTYPNMECPLKRKSHHKTCTKCIQNSYWLRLTFLICVCVFEKINSHKPLSTENICVHWFIDSCCMLNGRRFQMSIFGRNIIRQRISHTRHSFGIDSAFSINVFTMLRLKASIKCH